MKVLSVLLWIPFILIHTVGPLFIITPFVASWPWWTQLLPLGLIPLGLVIVPMALMTRYMTLGDPDNKHWPDLFWLWGNDEEGCPEWWLEEAKQNWWTRYWPQFWWYAIRNPVNNFRFLFEDVALKDCFILSNWDVLIPMEAKQLLAKEQAVAWYFIQSGWKSGYRRVWLNGADRYSEFWIGWKLANAVPGLGFTMQYRRKRKVGT